jgi:uncharacterized protein (DUF2236 family)
MHAGAVARAGVDQLARVVARPAADDDDDVGLARHFDGGRLAILSGLAHRVDEAHFGAREPPANEIHQPSHLLHRLRRLSGDAEARMFLERQDVGVFEDDIETIEIVGDTADLHMIALADDDNVIAVATQGGHRAMGHVDERACRLDHFQAEPAGAFERPLRRAVRGDHDGRRVHPAKVLCDSDAFGGERAEDGRIVHEVAENRERSGIGVLDGEGDGVSNAETHAEVGGAQDTHALQCKAFIFTMQSHALLGFAARYDGAMTAATDSLEGHRRAVRARLLRSGHVRGGPASVTWKINREAVVVAGWGPAILLQIAHPLIAAGVRDHSSFRGSLGSRFTRLASTIGAMLSLTFGSEEEAIGAAARINAIHDRVSGQLDEPAGSLTAGERYSAHDPTLLSWVHATLLHTIPRTYELLVGSLTTEERDRYVAEAAIMEPLLDIPQGLLPRTGAQLEAYMRDTLDSGRIAVSGSSRTLARAILFPPGWRLLWPVFRPVQLITIGLLPPSIREGYGFAWTPRDARALARWTAALRLLHRLLPAFVREWPAARRTHSTVRLSSQAGAECGLIERLDQRAIGGASGRRD